jgi:hypothetical protein
MKKMIIKSMMAAATIGLIGLFVMAADNTYRPGWYDDLGFTASDMVGFVIDSSTTTGYQIKRRTMTVPIDTEDAGIDTIWTQLFTVPAGQTYTVTEMVLSAHTEGDEATDTLHCGIYYYQGTAKATLDTAVAQFCVDDDSTIVYADTIYTMTLIDSVFTAGDIVTCWWMGPGGAMTGGEGAAITIEYIIDE